MANYFKNMNMGFVNNLSEEEFQGFMGLICSEGKAISGYYNLPYINYHFKDAQVILQTEKNDNDSLQISRIDTHVSGRCVWNLRVSGMNVNPKDALKTEKRCVLGSCEDASGMLVVNIVNADVLPSYMENDEITLQMVAYAEKVDYYASEDEYQDTLPKDDMGRTFGLANGTLFPSGIFNNRCVDPDDEIPEIEDDWTDNYMLVKGEVKYFQCGRIEDSEDSPEFVRCIIDTTYGELEIVHSMNSVTSEQRDNLTSGAIISAIVYLSGDAAIYDYDHGIVKDEEHNLKALRYSMTGGDANRLYSILADDVEYTSEVTGKTIAGKENVVNRIDYVNNNAEEKYYSHLATITDIKDGDDDLEYPVGKRCVILAFGEEDNFESILFIDCDEEGNVTRILTSKESRYCFSIDKPYYRNPFEGMDIPDTYHEPMVTRASYHGFVSGDIGEIIDTLDVEPSYEKDAAKVVDMIKSSEDDNIETVSENAFGYLFAKAIEKTISRAVVSYSLDDIRNDVFSDNANDTDSAKLQRAYKYGKQFFKDFSLYHSDEEDKEEYYDEMVNALTFVQAMGNGFAMEYINNDCYKD